METSIWPEGGGRFRAWTDVPVDVDVRAWFGEVFHEARATLVPGREIEFTLKPSPPDRAWLIHVHDHHGRPVAASDGDGFIRDGRITLVRPTKEKTRRVEIFRCRDDRGRPLPCAPTTAGPFPPGIHTVRLEPGRTVEGTVVTADERPVRGVWISAHEALENPENWGHEHARARTGVDGRFRLVGLGATGYHLSVTTPSAYLKHEPVPLAADATSVRIVAVRKVAARVTILDPEGRPVAGARVRLIAPDEHAPFLEGRLSRVTDGQGVVVFPLLSPRLRIALRVDPPAKGLRPLDDRDWSPADGTLRLERSHRIVGSVVDAEGQVVTDATIFVRPAPGARPLPEGFSFGRIEGGYVRAALVGEDGCFAITGLPAMRLEMFAVRVREDGTEQRSPSITVGAPATDIVLRLR